LKAVIDLGSNTFHLRIVKQERGVTKTVFRKRIFVRLLEDAFNNTITEEAGQRAQRASLEFYEKIHEYKVTNYQVIGTAAFRDSINGDVLKIELENTLHTRIRILSDIEEAMYIFKGVAQTLVNINGPYVIMDIGGGSVEFIVAEEKRLIFAKSYPIGLHKLAEMLSYNKTMSAISHKKLREICEEWLKDLQLSIQNEKVNTMVGNAGSFELCNTIAAKKPLNSYSTVLDIDKLKFYFDLLKCLPENEITQLNWIPENRMRMLPLAFAFIDTVIDFFNIEELIYSPNSVKEGILLEI